jgi:hypothetical protein
MARQTRHIVQTFVAGKGASLKPDAPILCKTPEEAIRRAESASASKIGTVAFTTSGDPDTGDYDERPTVLFKAGKLPPEFEN